MHTIRRAVSTLRWDLCNLYGRRKSNCRPSRSSPELFSTHAIRPYSCYSYTLHDVTLYMYTMRITHTHTRTRTARGLQLEGRVQTAMFCMLLYFYRRRDNTHMLVLVTRRHTHKHIGSVTRSSNVGWSPHWFHCVRDACVYVCFLATCMWIALLGDVCARRPKAFRWGTGTQYRRNCCYYCFGCCWRNEEELCILGIRRSTYVRTPNS